MKALKTILIFTLVFVLTSCGEHKGGAPKTSKEIDYTKNDKIELTCEYYPEYFVVLSDEQKEYVISLWQEGQWEPGEYKTHRPYRFKAGELIFTYDLDTGEFYDEKNDRTLFVSDEQIDTLKSYFAAVSADAISQITVGMTMSQVLDILGSSGTNVGSGEIIIQYACDDGTKCNIVYMYDYVVDSLVVWNIVKY